MEGMRTSLSMLPYVSTAIVCCYLQNAYGDHIFVTESADCVRATINCMMDYNGVLAYEPHLDQYEQDNGCSTAHLAIWLWNRQPYTCKFRNGAATTQSEDEQSTSYEHLTSSLSSSSAAAASYSTKMIIQDTKETHRYICVTNGVMGNKKDLCNPDAIRQMIDMELSKNYVNAIIGSSVGAVAILAMLVLLILYKRRTRERPTQYWPHTSNRSDDGTETVIITSAQDSSITKNINDHHYTLPKTTSSCVKMVNLVRPALRKTTDVRARASEADLNSLPYQYSERPHRGLCFTTSVGSKSGAVSAPDIHIYETIEPCNCTNDGTETVINKSAQDSPITKDINDHHYTLPKTTSSCVKMVNLVRPALKKTTDVRAWASEADLNSLPCQYSERPHRGLCFTTSVGSKSGAVSAPDIHIYENIEPSNCTNHRENTCRCKNCKTISKQLYHADNNHGYVEFVATSGAASAPDLHLYAEFKPCSCIDKLGNTCSCVKYTSPRLQSNPLHKVHDDMAVRVISGSASAPGLT